MMGFFYASHAKEVREGVEAGIGCREVCQVVALIGKDVHLYELWS